MRTGAPPAPIRLQHVAIDLGSKESQVCIRRPDGTILHERKYPTRKLTELVATWEPSRVVMETSAEAFQIADAAIAAGHQVRVVPATWVRLLGVGGRGVKNDQRDAQQLSKASWQTDVPSVHVPSHMARELRSICGARDVLVDGVRRVSNNVKGWLRTQLWRIRGCKAKALPEQIREHAALLRHPSANSRLRQPDTSWTSLTDDRSNESQPDNVPDERGLPWTRTPLHSRDLFERLPPI